MASYEKLTLDRFKQSLKEDKYVNLTGARRAIGKTTSWTAKEKEAAQDIALKHFGPSAAKTTAKTAKKTSNKIAKKVSAKAAAQAASPKKQQGKKRGPQRRSEVGHTEAHVGGTVLQAQASTIDEHRFAASETIALATATRLEFEHLKRMNPALDIVPATKQLHGLLENAISHMSHSVAGLPHPGGFASAAPRIELPELSTPRQNDVQVLSQPEETVGQIEENGIHDSDLTPEELRAKELFMKGTPSATAGLPRPA